MSEREAAVTKAARLFADQERKRIQRPLLTMTEKIELDVHLRALTGSWTRHRWSRSRRGEVAVALLAPNPEEFHAAAVATLADILAAVSARGLDPVGAMQEAWEDYSAPFDEHADEFALDEAPAEPVPATGPVTITDSMGFPLFIPVEEPMAALPEVLEEDNL